MTEIWIATGNPKKRGELDRLLRPLDIGLRLQSEISGYPEVVEDRPDFAGNAAKKALALATAVGAPALADDSGLCVDALDGRPGVHSARFAGEGASDADRIAKLLHELQLAERAGRGGARRARFVSSVCLAGGNGRILARFEESCSGVILEEPRGSGGFGYDPVFLADEFAASGRSFAELDAAEKDTVSHRGKALRRLTAWLEENQL